MRSYRDLIVLHLKLVFDLNQQTQCLQLELVMLFPGTLTVSYFLFWIELKTSSCFLLMKEHVIANCNNVQLQSCMTHRNAAWSP